MSTEFYRESDALDFKDDIALSWAKHASDGELIETRDRFLSNNDLDFDGFAQAAIDELEHRQRKQDRGAAAYLANLALVREEDRLAVVDSQPLD